MRIRFKKSDLLPAAAIVQSVANPQSTLPILSNVLITTDHDNIATLSATDYETRVRIEVAAEVEKKGAATVPARTFYDLIKELPEDGEVMFEAKEKGAHIKCRDIRAELATMPARDFPKWPELEPTVSFDLPQRDLRRLLDQRRHRVDPALVSVHGGNNGGCRQPVLLQRGGEEAAAQRRTVIGVDHRDAPSAAGDEVRDRVVHGARVLEPHAGAGLHRIVGEQHGRNA